MTERKGKYTIRRVDANQGEIVTALREFGASVLILSSVGHGCPDLLVGWMGCNFLMEVKTRTGRLTADERDFSNSWRGGWVVVRTPEQAIEYIQNYMTERED